MKNRKLALERTKSFKLKAETIGFSILIILFLSSMSSANDKSDIIEYLNSNQSDIKKNVIKENYFQDTKSYEIFETDLIDMNPQEIAKNIENISKKYNIDINNISENIAERNNDVFNEDIIDQSFDEEKTLLIRLSGEITIKDIIDFYKSGINLYYPASKNTVIVRIKAGNITKLKSYPFISGIREYKEDDKIKPSDKIRIDQMIRSDSNNATNQPEGLLRIYIWSLGKGNETYVHNLQQLGVEKISYDNSAKVYGAEVSPSKIYSILSLEWVRKVGIEKEKKLSGIGFGFLPGDSREIINAPSVWPFYTGNNISVGVYDTGIWDQHPDFTGAVIHPDPDGSGHGTHVSGIIASRGTRDIEGKHNAKGIAYGSKLYVIDSDNSIDNAFMEFKNNSIYIVNNAWNAPGIYDYDLFSEGLDSKVENDHMTVVVSAGNTGEGGARTILEPALAKNVITVGAISYTIEGDSGGVGKVALYSSKGPTNYSNRLKPDVVAPGGDVSDGYRRYGVVSTNAKNGTGFWLDDINDTWPTDSNYTRMAGTSMAAPHVAGTVALINESFRNISFSDGLQPRDYKALLIESAIPLKGYGTDARNGYANTDVGYGLIDAYLSIFDITGEKQTLLWGHGELIETISNTEDWNIDINGTEKKLAVVLAYEDNAGQIDETHVLKDDLDLRITSPNGTVFNYTLPENVTAEEPEEKIVIDNPSIYGNGTWTIRVEGASWDTFPFDYQKYTVIANAYYVDPSLEINAASTINVVPGANFTLSPTLKNTGGLTVAGITVNVSTNTSGFGGDINNDTFVGNIVGKGNSKSASFNITAPVTLGEYNLSISAKGINHDLNTPDNKIVKVSVGSLSGWNNRKLKTINGTTTGAQTNYQMKLTIYNTSGSDTPGIVYLNGSTRSDFGDLRFTKSDGVTLLDYWIESYTSGVSAVVWVEVDSIPASTADIYLYYGNPSTTSISNGASTFMFFDHFNDLNNWSTDISPNYGESLSASFSNSEVTITTSSSNSDPRGSYAIKKTSTAFSPNAAIRTRYRDNNAYWYPGGFGFGVYPPYQSANNVIKGIYTHGQFNGVSAKNGTLAYSSGTAYDNTYYIWDLIWTSNKTQLLRNGVSLWSNTNSAAIPTVSLNLGMGDIGQYGGGWSSTGMKADWILVRNCVNPEPAWI